MIIKIKKRDLSLISLFLFFIALIPFIFSADQISAQKGGFGVWLVISNTVPNVTLNNITVAVDPSAGSMVEVIISFNVTDAQGVGDINASTAVVNLTLGGFDGQWRSNVSDQGSEYGTCNNHTESGVVVINCSVWMMYYDNASNWAINVSIEDINGGVGRNDTNAMTYNQLASFVIDIEPPIEEDGLNFTSLNVGAQNEQAKAPILLNNTGNDDFDQINITAADLISSTTIDTIPAASFAVNITSSTTDGRGLALSTSPQTIPATECIGGSCGSRPNATLMHGLGGRTAEYLDGPTHAKGNQSFIFWIDVPTGKAAAVYNNTWNLTVVDID